MTTIKVKTYAELKSWIRRFIDGRIEILFVLSKAGLGKTEMIESMMKDIDYGYINAHTTPLSLFEIGYKFRNKLMVIDDIDTVLDNNDLVSLFKQFAETKEIKHIEWNSTSGILEKIDIPQEYDTSSKILLVGNRVRKVASLIDRGFCIVFEPSRQEKLNKIEEIADEMKVEKKKRDEIIKLLKTMGGNLTLRTFRKAVRLYGEIGWDECIAKSMSVSVKTIICEKIARSLPRERWLEAWKFFAQSRGDEWSRTNFYDHFKRLNFDESTENFDAFDIEKTLDEFRKSVESVELDKKHRFDIRHPVKTQNLWDLSQNKRDEVSKKHIDAKR